MEAIEDIRNQGERTARPVLLADVGERTGDEGPGDALVALAAFPSGEDMEQLVHWLNEGSDAHGSQHLHGWDTDARLLRASALDGADPRLAEAVERAHGRAGMVVVLSDLLPQGSETPAGRIYVRAAAGSIRFETTSRGGEREIVSRRFSPRNVLLMLPVFAETAQIGGVMETLAAQPSDIVPLVEMIDRILDHEDEYGRAFRARHPFLPHGALSRLLQHPSREVRERAGLLAAEFADDDPDVARLIEKNG